MLRRKPAFQRESVLTPTKAVLPVYLKRSPLSDYKPIGVTSSAWIGLYRDSLTRQLAVIEEIKGIDIEDFRLMCEVAHQNVARPTAIYYDELVHIAYEHVELGLADISPLSSEMEVASVMSQIYEAVTSLFSHSLEFRISAVRISLRGVVKLVLDWSHKPDLDPELRVTTYELTATSLANIMETIGESIEWSEDAMHFQGILKSGCLPQASVHAHYPIFKQDKRLILKSTNFLQNLRDERL